MEELAHALIRKKLCKLYHVQLFTEASVMAEAQGKSVCHAYNRCLSLCAPLVHCMQASDFLTVTVTMLPDEGAMYLYPQFKPLLHCAGDQTPMDLPSSAARNTSDALCLQPELDSLCERLHQQLFPGTDETSSGCPFR